MPVAAASVWIDPNRDPSSFAESPAGPAGPFAAETGPPRFPRPLRVNPALGEGGLLGRGGIGQVWAARDYRTGREFAVKMLHPHLAGEPELVARFEREASIAAGFRERRDPGVPLFHGYRPGDRSRGKHALLVTELIRGETFKALLTPAADAAARSRQDLLTLFRKAVKVAARSHGAGLVHRDLKPANLMATRRNPGRRGGGHWDRVVVVDWGMAREVAESVIEHDWSLRSRAAPHTDTVTDFGAILEDTFSERPAALPAPTADQRQDATLRPGDTARGTVMGSVPYMAPEQARGEQPDFRTDVYSLGLILLEILTGAPARPGATKGEMVDAARRGHMGEALARLEHCDAGARLVGLCARCVARRRTDRPADGAALLAELDRLSVRGRGGTRRWDLGDAG